MFPRPNFFDGCMLNFADNLLHPRDAPNENQPAMISVTESTVKSITWRAMREKVLRLALAMNSLGIQPCDRVAGFLGNHADTVIAMLATTYLGAIWTAVSPDTGVVAVLDRLVQIEPVMLFADNAVEYNGKIHESVTKTRGIAEALRDLKAVVIFESVLGFAVDPNSFNVANGQAWTYDAFVQE
jgi:acetoacetyl-CoA synthetase